MHDRLELCDRVLEIASNPRTCSDGVAMIFADMELQHKVFMAQTEASADVHQVKLARDLNLPVRPGSMRFERIARVTAAELEIAKA